MDRVYKSNVVYNLKGVINNYYDLENKRVLEKGRNGDILPIDRRILLKDIIDLCLYTNYTNMEFKIYLTSPGVILSNLSEVILNKTGSSVNDMTARNKVGYCRKKIANDLGEDIILKILDKRLPDLSDYVERVANTKLRYMDFNLGNVYAIDLNNVKPNIKKASYEDMRSVLNKLDAYTKKNVDKLLSDEEKEVLGYIKYLNCSDTADENELKIKNYIRSI